MNPNRGLLSCWVLPLGAAASLVCCARPAPGQGPTAAGPNPWADAAVSYDPGATAVPGFKDPTAALGEPTRFTGKLAGFPGAVTPFNPAFDTDEIVSIGAGGHLTLRFDEPVRNDPANPWEIDLLIFGNTGYIDVSFPRGCAGVPFGTGEAMLELSRDGQVWTPAPGIAIDSLFPTLGYSDLTSPYAVVRGLVETDFTRPVRPTFDAAGSRFGRIVRAYNGSGGGTGVDIGAFGLDQVSFVRISVGRGAFLTTEIDAVADVTAIPAPAGLALLLAGSAGLWPRPRRTRGVERGEHR